LTFPNKNLFIVVSTQNKRCNTIPNKNNTTKTKKKLILNKKLINKAPAIVAITSTMAMLKIR
jgi:hypothetical protein